MVTDPMEPEEANIVTPEEGERAVVVRLAGASVAQDDTPVLSQVDLEVRAGDFVFLTGRVGSGKSSLIGLLTGQLPLQDGEGAVCGFDLARLKSRDIPYLRRQLGIIFQDFKLLPDRNVAKNLRFALRATGWRNGAAIEQRITDVLEQVGLLDKMDKMPNQLSGGEQQRVAIARAVLNEPALLLADEPTGNLDPAPSEGILELLVELAQRGAAVIMATHNYGIVNRYTASTYQCEQGRLSEVDRMVTLDFSDL